MESREIKVDQINKVLNYLASKPFIEVHQLIAELQQLPLMPQYGPNIISNAEVEK